MSPEAEDLTRILGQIAEGNSDARTRLWQSVYDQLKSIAGRKMRRESPQHTLGPTALVNEVYLRLRDLEWENRRHFFFAAARAMRQILVDHARKKKALKQGGEWERVPLDFDVEVIAPGCEIEELDEALERLSEEQPRKAEVILLHHYAGLTIDETARILEVSRRTVDKDLRFAKACLREMIARPGSN